MSGNLKITPITAVDLPAVGRFLHEQLNRRFSPERWIQSLTQSWAAEVPNHGTQLHDGEQLVGVFCAVYSDQLIHGRVERFCNPHSWCVLDSHRRHGIGLLLQLLRQKGYHFTMFTPNPKVAEVFRGLKFRELDARQWVHLNLPSPAGLLPGRFVTSDLDEISRRLVGQARADFQAHRHLPWLNFSAFGDHEGACFVIYKPTHFKSTRCAWLMHVSDAAVYSRLGGLLRAHLLRRGYVTSRIEGRWLAGPPPRAVYHWPRTQPKLVQSTLADADIRDLYSELMSLDV